MDPLRGRDESGTARDRAGSLRVFFAVELPAQTRAAAATLGERLREAPGGGDVRWVKAENLHVTLRFLAAVAASRIDALVERVAAEVAPLRAFALHLGAVRLFPTPRRPHVVALEVGPEAALVALAEAVERGVVAAGEPPETRSFRAHLTLGRLGRERSRGRVFADAFAAPPGAERVTAADTPAGETFDVTEVVLIRSELQPSGSRYTPLARVPLAPPGAPPVDPSPPTTRNT